MSKHLYNWIGQPQGQRTGVNNALGTAVPGVGNTPLTLKTAVTAPLAAPQLILEASVQKFHDDLQKWLGRGPTSTPMQGVQAPAAKSFNSLFGG